MIGLADCNNFFVSCERSVNPALEGRPVVVMSNNDGCVVARSNEAKALGIKMGQPVFEIKSLVSSGKVIALSGQHLLYRDISLRIHDIFRKFVPHTIDYSIDESFLDMSGIPDNMLLPIGEAICKRCWEELHIPVTIGFATTKTLAKIVTETSKKEKISVSVLDSPEEKLRLCRMLPIGELWGIGRRLTKRLYQAGVFTIADFAAKNRHWVRTNYGVNGERSWLELHGVDCITLNHVERLLQDSISETRTFPEDIDDYDYIRARIVIYGSDCAKKLRAMSGVCKNVTVFLRSNRFHPERGIYSNDSTLSFQSYTDSTQDIVGAAICALDKIFLPTVTYKRAGVLLSDIIPREARIQSLFDNGEDGIDGNGQSIETYHNTENGNLHTLGRNHNITLRNESKLLQTVDKINASPGRPTLKLASQLTIHTIGHNDGYSSSFQAPFNPQKK